MGGNETTKRRKVTEPKTSSTAAKALAAAGAAKVKPEAVPAPCPEVQIASDAAPAPPEQVPAPATPTATAIASGTPATSAPNQALEQEDLAALAAMTAQPQASTPATPLPFAPRLPAPAPTPFLRPRRSDGTKTLHRHCKVAPLELAIATYAKDGALISEHFDSSHPVHLLMLLQKGSQSAPTMTYHWKDTMQKYLTAMASAPGAPTDAPRQLDGLAPYLHSLFLCSLSCYPTPIFLCSVSSICYHPTLSNLG